MTKKLNVDAITNELAESAFFRRPQREQLEIDKHTPLPEKPIIQEEQSLQAIHERSFARSPVRPNVGPPARSYGTIQRLKSVL